VEPAPGGDLRVGFGNALLVLPAGSGELEGLHNRPDIAASIARRSGGRVLAGDGAEGEEAPSRASPDVTLLVAAALVALGAALRRRG
jgi:hypothetical protein